jgi:hypothetical protein
MLKKLDEGRGNVLGYEVTGKLTEEEYERLAEDFKAVVAEHGKVRLLLYMPETPRVASGAVLEDLKLAPYTRDIERYAIVGDVALADQAEKLGNVVLGGEMAHFEGSRYEEAWRWIES